MYIAIYVSAIVLLCACAIIFFIVKDRKNRKLGEKLKQQAKEENQIPETKIEKDFAKVDDLDSENTQNEPQNQNELEDFSLEIEKQEKKNKKLNFDLNPFNLDEGFASLKGNQDVSKSENADEDDLDKKFKEYEEFLRRNLDLDDDDFEDDEQNSEDGEEPFEKNLPDKNSKNADLDTNFDPFSFKSDRLDDDELRALQNFDFESLKDKNEEEIAEIIKSLPPKAQEILLSDILARRKFEDEE